MWPHHKYRQRTHSKIPTYVILYNFNPVIWPLKPDMFIIPMLILNELKSALRMLVLYLSIYVSEMSLDLDSHEI